MSKDDLVIRRATPVDGGGRGPQEAGVAGDVFAAVRGSVGEGRREFDGRAVFENGEPTGELPGRLLRGVRPAPRV